MSKNSTLIVTPLVPPESGGPSYYSVELQKALQRKGEEVDLIAFKEVRNYPSILRHFLFLYKVLIRARKARTLIILDSVSVALPAVIAGWILKKKMVVRVGGDFVWERYIERTGDKLPLSEFYSATTNRTVKEKILIWLQKNVVLNLATYVVFNTQWQRDLWHTPYDTQYEKTGVIKNAFMPTGDMHQGGEAFLAAWRPTAFKNIDTLEHAYELAKEKYPDMALTIYKDVPREELHEHMKHARALIVPSLTELSPNIAFEALAMGLPVLLTKDCGAYDLLDGSVTWIDPLDAGDIAEKMCALMDTDTYEAAKEKSSKAVPPHTYDDIAEKFLEFLR